MVNIFKWLKVGNQREIISTKKNKEETKKMRKFDNQRVTRK